MRKKIFAITMSVFLAFSVTACGTAAEQSQPVDDTPTIAEVAAEMEAAAEETEAVEAAAETEAVVEEPEETETEELVEETETEVAETETEVDPMEALLESNMGSYVSDGNFDTDIFGKDAGASARDIGNYSFTLLYDNWFIQAGNEANYPDIGYIAIGNWDGSNVTATYSYLFPSGNDVSVNGEITVPVECIIHLQDIISYVKENGPNVAPDVPGTDFHPCDPADETIQY